MLKRLVVFRASLPAVLHSNNSETLNLISFVASMRRSLFLSKISGGRRSISGAASNASSSSAEILNTRSCQELHTATASSKSSLDLPGHEVDVVENFKDAVARKEVLRDPTGPTLDASRSFFKPAPRSETEEDDDFAELGGPSVLGDADSGFNLTTEKHEVVDQQRKMSYNGSQNARTSNGQDYPAKTSSFGISAKQDHHHPHKPFDQERQKSTFQSMTDSGDQMYPVENNQSYAAPFFISIEKIPPDIRLQELREAISRYGEILKTSMRKGWNDFATCTVEFKDVESKQRAIAARWLYLNNFRLSIRSLPLCTEYIAIRITNINTETAEGAIHSMCTTYGHVSGLARTKEGAVDVVFKVKDMSFSKNILKHLNDVNMDDCEWSAKLLPKLDNISTTIASDSQWQVGSQISSHLGSIRKKNQMQKIYLEDLEDLHNAVLHLRDQPPELHNSLAPDDG